MNIHRIPVYSGMDLVTTIETINKDAYDDLNDRLNSITEENRLLKLSPLPPMAMDLIRTVKAQEKEIFELKRKRALLRSMISILGRLLANKRVVHGPSISEIQNLLNDYASGKTKS